MKKKIMTGIIGAGRIGKTHTENIKRYVTQAEIKTIADTNLEGIRDWASGLEINNLTEDYKDIINDPGIDVVFICSPTDTHTNLIIEASKAGKHIFCEKPIDLNVDKIKMAMKAVDDAKIKFQIGFHRRFDRDFRKVHDIIRSGEIGRLYITKLISWDPQPPWQIPTILNKMQYMRTCGGIFMDMTIHDFDMARYLTGSEVVEVYANATALVDPEMCNRCNDYDTAVISLKFEDGSIGIIENSRKAAHGNEQRVEVLGSEGAVTISSPTPSLAVISTAKGICHEKPENAVIKNIPAYIEEVKEFFDAVINDKETSVKAIDGLRTVEVGLAALKSARENRPVRVSEIG